MVAGPFLFKISSFYFSFWSCVRSPSCPSVIERRIIRICYFWQNNEKRKIKGFLFGVNISPLPSELCLLQLTSLTKRFPNDPAPTLLSRMELPSGSIAIYWRQLALSCSQLLSLVYFGLKLFWLPYVFWTEYLPLVCLFLREDCLPLWRASSLSGEDVVVTPAASSRAGRQAV